MQSKSDSILEKIANMQKVKKFMEMGMSKEDAMKKAYPNMKKEAKMEMAPKKKSNFGMLSVKAGIDNNPAPTKADRIAGAKMKKAQLSSVKLSWEALLRPVATCRTWPARRPAV